MLMVSDRVKRSPQELAEAIFRRNPATVLQITPSLYHRLPTRELPDRLLGQRSRVRILALGGEQFPSMEHLSCHKAATVSSQLPTEPCHKTNCFFVCFFWSNCFGFFYILFLCFLIE